MKKKEDILFLCLFIPICGNTGNFDQYILLKKAVQINKMS